MVPKFKYIKLELSNYQIYFEHILRRKLCLERNYKNLLTTMVLKILIPTTIIFCFSLLRIDFHGYNL